MNLRPTGRWPLAVAAVFCVYSLVLLWNAFQSQQQLRVAADARLVADSKRRATALGEFAAQQRNLAADLAASHELRTYHINKALGMSPRYGLDASLDAVEQRLRAGVGTGKPEEAKGLRRAVFFDILGQVLADTGAEPGAQPLPAVAAGPAMLTLDLARRAIVVTAPVTFKGEFSGTLVTFSDIGQLYHSLLQLDTDGSYRETLLTTAGQEIAAPSRSGLFNGNLAYRLAHMAPNQPTPLAELAGTSLAVGLRNAVAVTAPVPGMPAVLVTSLSRAEIYGDLSSSWFLGSLSVFPALMLLAALRMGRLQQRARLLELDAMRADAQRQVLQQQNESLSTEICRREAVEAELQSHRDRLEELVRQRSAELNRLFDALPDLYFRTARDGTVLEHRAGRDAELPMAAELFLGKRMQDVLPADAATPIGAALDALAHGAEHSVAEFGLPMAQGQAYFEARVVPLDTDQCVVVVRNVTERREFEEQREANRREAERLVRVKSEFLANMSHEIRTPLNAVLGLAQIGARGNGDRATCDSFERIEEAGRHLLGIIDDILDLSKLEAGKLSMERRPFHLAEVVDAAVRLVAGRTAVKGLALRVDVAGDLPQWVLGDAMRLKQVLVNLLANAVKFTAVGEVVLSVSGSDGQITLRIADTGIGLDAAQRARLFQPFEQADGSITRRFGGTGLGLAICRNLVGLMGGDIGVESQPGVGSVFTVHLPLSSTPAPRIAPVSAALPGQRLAGLRVLAAEDVEVNRIVLEGQLRHEGAQVVFVEDGQAAVLAVARADGAAFSAVLMDVQMPVMDGLTATRHIRKLAPQLPVIGLTAYALPEERERCLAAGMVERVVKPADLDLLVAALLRHAVRPADLPLASLAQLVAA